MAVYFIRAGEGGPVKIGTTVDVEARRRDLQTAHYKDLILVREIEGGLVTEAWLHDHFIDHWMRGEWHRWTDAMSTIAPPTEFEIVAAATKQPRPRPGRSFALLAAIDVAGSTRALANSLGIAGQAVSQWKRIPPLRALEVERVTGISRHVLRPDVYPLEAEPAPPSAEQAA